MKILLKLLAILVSRLPKGVFTLQETFNIFQSRGIHITPVHFFQPTPNTAELDDEVWERTSELIDVKINRELQESLLAEFSGTYIEEFRKLPDTQTPPYSYSRDVGFPGFDGAFIYSFIRKYKPRKIIEIGSGASTLLMSDALTKNAQENQADSGKISAIEPYPREFLINRLPKEHKLTSKKVQSIPLEYFSQLGEGDVLFIDSSHVSKIDSDVNYEILEILPRLNKGVIVHFHDIYMPGEYPKEWIMERKIFWNEQYILQAFLTSNPNFEMMWSAGYMKVHCMAKLQEHIPDLVKGWAKGGSLWLRKCG